MATSISSIRESVEDGLHQHLSFAFPKRKKGEYSVSVEVQGWLRSLKSGGLEWEHV